LTAQQQAFTFAPAAPEHEAKPPARRNVVIEAGAGTGKTTAIVAEVLALLLGDETLAPERIVLMTFTEKAAGEIADRIHQALTEIELALGSGEDRRAEARPTSGSAESTSEADRSNPEGNRSKSEANRVNSEGPMWAGLQPGIAANAGTPVAWPIGSAAPLYTIEPSGREAARRACAAQLARIDSLRSQTIHSFCQMLLRQHPIEAELDPQFRIVEGFERSLLIDEAYDAWVDEETRIHPTPELLRDWEHLLGHAPYLFQVRELILELVNRRDLAGEEGYETGSIDDAEPEIAEAVRTFAIAGDADSAIARYVRANEPPARGDLDGWIAYLRPIAGEIRVTDLPKRKNDAALKSALQNLRGGKKGDCVVDRLTSHRAAVALLSMTRRFLRFLDEEKRRRGVVDFDDLLLRTEALLRNEAVAERVRGQFDFIFVDEFQDTDRVQARIVDRLSRDARGLFVAGKTVVVGDPKQSIYGFRRADPETYDAFTRALGARGAEERALVEQYRSDPPLLEAINAIFATLLPPAPLRDANVFRPAYRELRAAKESSTDLDARVTLLHAGSDDRGDRHTAEAEAIAAWIEARRGRGLRSFALLFRRLTKLDDYLDVFHERGIDYVLPPTKLFLDRPAAVDLLAVLRAIAYPFDRGAEISAARSPYFALTDFEIARGIGERAAECGPADPYVRVRESLQRFRAAARQLTMAQLAELVIETCGIERLYAAAADGTRSLRHLEHLRSIAFTYDQKIGGSVRQFVDEIARRRGEPDEAEPSLVDEAGDAVRILSVHAAKGLEFETVILPDLEFKVDPPEIFLVDEPRNLVMTGQMKTLNGSYRNADGRPLADIGAEREEAENRRLFYVAVTRARREVVFVTAPKPQNKGFAQYVKPLFQPELAPWPEGSGRVVEPMSIGGRAVPVAFERIGAAAAASRGRRRLADRALEETLAAGDIAGVEVPLPEIATLTRGALIAERASSRRRAAGILLHRVLERWDGAAPPEPLLRATAAEGGHDDETVTLVAKRLAAVRASQHFTRIIGGETVARELSIAFLDDDGNVVERRVDRLLQEPGGDVVVDYKSGAPHPLRAERDESQVAAYCRAVSRLRGRPCRGLLWYIDLEGDRVVEVRES
jgi:ATP-dependent exoDNAse (exonuclease V) beta subunit